MVAAQSREVLSQDGTCLPRLECRHCRRTLARPTRDEREVSERLARPADAEHRRLPERSRDRDGEAPLDDQMEGVRRISPVKDDFAAAKGPAAGDCQ